MKRIAILLLVSMAVVFASCEKDTESADLLIIAAQEDDLITTFYDEVDTETDQVTMPQPVGAIDFSKEMSEDNGRNIATVLNADKTVTKTVTYTNWTNANGNSNMLKNGKIVITTGVGPEQKYFLRTISLVNFSINGVTLQGTKTISKTGPYTYSVICNNGKAIFPDGSIYTRNINRTKTWVEGSLTPYNIWDDVFTVEGTATGINRIGKTYLQTITNPLLIKRTCKFIGQGTIAITIDLNEAILDYGTGTCDNLATITYNDQTKVVKLNSGI